MNRFRRFANILEPYSPHSSAPVFEWETEGDDLLLRSKNGDLQVVWAYLGQARLGQKLQNPRTLRTSGRRVRGAFNARRLWRMWPLENGEVAFFRAEFGLLRFADDRELVEWKMPRGEFKTALDAFGASGEVVARLFERLERDQNSELHLARQWRETHRNPWATLEFRRGSHEDLEALMRAVAHLLFDPQKVSFWSWTPAIFTLYRKRNSFPLASLFPHALLEWNASCRSAAERICAVVEEEFEVHVESSRWRGYDWTGTPSLRRWPKLHFVEATMHEKLEAQLFLRNWLHTKIPDAELEALFKSVST